MQDLGPFGIREIFLRTIEENRPTGQFDPSLKEGTILASVALKLKPGRSLELQLAILTQWHELFRTGLLAWGASLNDPCQPSFHLTQPGRTALANLTRDPYNPAGYRRHLDSVAKLDVKTGSYLDEALSCFSAGLHRAAAILLGVATECEILRLKAAVISGYEAEQKALPKGLVNWQIKPVLDSLSQYFSERKNKMPSGLSESVEANWLALTYQIRSSRNEAGHPTTLETITSDRVHASFLLFPELAKMITQLLQWLETAPTSASHSSP